MIHSTITSETCLTRSNQIVDSIGLIPFEPWIRTLVPYVAGLTVRSPHFQAGSLAAMGNVDVQMSRLMEMTRAVAPLMAADWHMITAPPGSGFVINDRGLTWTQDEGDRIGIVVPINHSRALVILPNPDRYIARRDPDGIWRTSLPRRELSAEAVRDLNVVMAQTAVYWVAGALVSDLEGLTFGDGDTDRTVLGHTWPDRGPLGAHDQDWLAAMHHSQLALGRNDWQPFAIFSSVEPGVRLHQTPEGLFLHHSLEVLQG